LLSGLTSILPAQSAARSRIGFAERCANRGLTPLIEYEISLKDLKRLAMKLTDEAQGAVEFGRFRLLPHRRELRAEGVAIELGSRAFDVLMVLIEARGGLVTKDEILSRVWPDTVVEENNLVVQISALRKALGEDRDFIRRCPAGATGSSPRSALPSPHLMPKQGSTVVPTRRQRNPLRRATFRHRSPV